MTVLDMYPTTRWKKCIFTLKVEEVPVFLDLFSNSLINNVF